MNNHLIPFHGSFAEMKLMHGDELRVRYLGELHKPWSGVGHVIKIPDSILLFEFSDQTDAVTSYCFLISC